ncbi:LysR family transcriptional regulator [Frateuria aurantia]
MELSHLRVFVEVATTGSITAASRNLHRVPSNLSVRIQQLETDLGCQLFLRDRQRLRLSPAGTRLLEHARKILALCDEARWLAQDDRAAGTLSLAVLDVGLVSRVPRVLAAYRQSYPEVVVSLHSGMSGEVEQQVLSGQVELGLSDGPVENSALENAWAFDEELFLVTEAKHAPVRCISQLAGREFFSFGRSCSYRLRLEAWLEQGGQLPRITEMESYQSMLACVSAGTGVAWVPQSVLKALPKDYPIRTHRLGAVGHSALHFIWRKAGLSGNALRFMQQFKQQEQEQGRPA